MNNTKADIKNHLYWLDTIKGIACWVVFLGHFRVIHTYIPLISEFADPRDYLSFIYNQTTALNVFYVISAFLVARTFMHVSSDFGKRAGIGIVKRYFRLSIPVFVSEMLIFVFQNIGIWSNRHDASPARHISVGEVLYDSFFKSMFYGSDSVNYVFWMIFLLFWGYVVVIVECAILSAMKKKYRYLFLILLMVVLGLVHNDFTPFSFGLFLYLLYEDMYVEGKLVKIKNPLGYVLGFIMIIASSWFAGQDEQIAYFFLKNGYMGFSTVSYAWCWVAAFLLLLGIVLCAPVLRFLDNKKFGFWGKICFPVFLFHWPCILTFGSCVYNLFSGMPGLAVHATKASLIVSFFATVILSVTYVKLIEPHVNKLIFALVKKINED